MMKILLKVISAFLYCNFVIPVLTYYIYDDNPLAGYVSDTYPHSGYKFSIDKKRNSEYLVDSHFKSLKSSPQFVKSTLQEDIRNNVKETQKINDQTKREWEQKSMQEENNGGYLDTRRRNDKDVRTPQAFNSPPINMKDTSNSPSSVVKQQLEPRTLRPKVEHRVQIGRGIQVMKESLYDNKPSFVEVNVRKTQVSTDPQRVVKMNNIRQPTALSAHGVNVNPMAFDKRQHRSVSHSVHNSQIISRILDDLTRKLSERSYKKSEYKKRDTSDIQRDNLFAKTKHTNISDNMKKFIGKEKTLKKDYRSQFIMEQGRYGSMEARDTPYALFYRMNPDTLDQRDGFVLKGSMEVALNNIMSNNKKRYPEEYPIETDLKNVLTKNNSNSGKLHMKVKRFKGVKRY